MSNIIDSIRMSGTTYAISDSGGTKVVEITQSDYDNLPTSAKTANIMYVITDAEPFDVSNYYTKAETSGATELATAFAATQPKLSAGTNITIDANNVISAEGGGGKAVVGGRGITVTSGETADTINCTLPLSAGSNDYSVVEGQYCIASGYYSHAEGQRTTASTTYSHAAGFKTKTSNSYEFVIGKDNVSNKANTTFGNSGNTLFAVGNGGDYGMNPYHNAFEVRQNGDIYIADTNDTSTSNFYEKPMIKLQDALGGGGIDSGTVQTMIDQSISGKTNQTDFVSHSGNTSIHVTAQDKTNWNNKSDFSGSYNDLTDKPTIPIVPTNVSSFNNDAGYITSNDISGKTNQSDFVSHSGNTTMHVTASEKSTWNAKSDFSGNYNDLSNKPTIPTSASQLTNDSGYITSSALNGYATEAYVTAATNDMATKTWVGQQGYLTQHQDISGKQDVSGMTAYTETSAFTAHTANTTVHVTANEKSTWNAKSDFSGSYNDLTDKPTLFSGSYNDLTDKPTIPSKTSDLTNDSNFATSAYVDTKLSISDFNTYSGTVNTAIGNKANSSDVYTKSQTSGATELSTALNAKLDTTAYTPTDLSNYYQKNETSGATEIATALSGKQDTLTIDPTLNKNSSNAVANSAITNNTLSGGVESNNYFRSVRFYKNNGEVAFYKRFAAINGNSVMVDGTTEAPNFQLVGTSAITTSVTSASTDVQIPSAKAVYDAIQEGGGGGGNSVVELTQSEYDALVTGGTVDPNTFYVITDAQEIDTDDYYTKSQTSGATELETAFGAKLDATAYTPTDLSNYYTKSETSGSSEISTALATKLNVSDFNTYSGTVNTSLSSKASQNDLDTVSGDVVSLSGQVSTNTSNISTVSASTASNTTALGGLSLVKLTQSAYDALTTKDPNTLYVIVN